MANRIKVTTEIDTIHVSRGQCLTVYMTGGGRQVQVELRVLHNGTPEVFCDNVALRSFEVWEPMSVVEERKLNNE